MQLHQFVARVDTELFARENLKLGEGRESARQVAAAVLGNVRAPQARSRKG